MKYCLKNRLFLIKKDIGFAVKQNKAKIFFYLGMMLLGVALGIYIGVKVGAKATPFGVFSALFHLEYAPFAYLVPDFLRFLLFLILCLLAYFLPFPKLYPSIATVLVGKYFGEIACVCFQSDSLLSFVLSVALVYLPLLFCAGSLLTVVAIRSNAFRLVDGADRCGKSVKKTLFFAVKTLLVYLLILFLIYVVLCGVLYLILIAL